MSDTGRPAIEEPRLTTRRVRRRRVPRHVLVALPLALAGLISLLVSGNTLRPFEHITTLDAKMASKSDFFKDPEVRRLLLRHGIRVDIHRLGSRGREFLRRHAQLGPAADAVPTFPVQFGEADAKALRKAATATGGRMVDAGLSSLSDAFKEIRGCH
ncbi:hypothetical protein [Streptomyces sp. NPDC001381]|uniref:hypothetical protein n=1 Tax=Streptomyces sp. NPDC001381 TaxID=3364567 RepID=UPI003696D3F8